MDGEDRGNSSGSSAALGLLAGNGQSVKKLTSHPVKVVNGDVNLPGPSGNMNLTGSPGDVNPAGSSGDVLRTYKRRKRTKVVEEDKDPEHLAGQSTEKSMSEPLDTAVKECCSTQASVAHVKPLGDRKGSIIDQMLQSLEKDSWLKEYILKAHSGVDAKESVCGPSQNGAKAASVNEPKSSSVTELCQHTFLDIFRSEKFSQLCHVLSENFEGANVAKFFDIRLIDSRMKDGSYESLPLLFHSDIQQVWTKLHEVGCEMVALSRSLTEISSSSFRAQVSGSVHENTGGGKDELAAKAEQAEMVGVNKTRACGRCGEKAEGRDSLVCDSCEEIYHVSCVEPGATEIPLRSWFCGKCSAKGVEPPHDDCVVCERLNASKSFVIEDKVEDMVVDVDTSNGLVVYDGGVEDLQHCNVCRTEVRSGEDIKECGHAYCPHKYYHERCLSRKQLDSHGPCWYCPSCLCRACLVDCEDDKIVLCDGCDHAYHIFCMQPPQNSIPRGKWFCIKCNVQIESINKAKRTFETLQNELKRRGEACVVKGKAESGGGMDMLLSAANSLNYQDNLAAFGDVCGS